MSRLYPSPDSYRVDTAEALEWIRERDATLA
jgi:hypothetical protein